MADKLVAGLRVGQLGSAVFFQNEKKKPCFGMPRGTKCVPAAFEKFSKLLKMLALVSSTRAYGALTNGPGRASLLRSGFPLRLPRAGRRAAPRRGIFVLFRHFAEPFIFEV
ncbi:hypothetical protein [Novosphingobium resinovorum]|uniref:hypothetical protein n=1 Tax=Novosphingobium resinovorum TaxID=158500 RepID=UPI0012E9E777|nr:hypothetical protein [Novosphingobium resinovorum]